MRTYCAYLVLLLLFAVFSCQEKSHKQINVMSKNDMKKSMERANRYLLNEEEEEIANYVRRHGLEMITTGTGLRYQVVKQGTGPGIVKGDRVALEYDLCSLSGDVIYSSEKDGVKTFVVGAGSVESGLDEAMTYLHKGDVAKLIIPYHLGFGLHGDENRIPGYVTLVYTIKIIENK